MPPAEVELDVGTVLGPYRLERLLGEGGVGYVFRATSVDDGSPVALKVVKPRVAADPDYARRFTREARAAGEVVHEHLVGVLSFGQVDGHHYLAMPFVEGESLDRRLEREGRLGVGDTIEIAREVAAGLDALHAGGVVHRDVKAANILLEREGAAKLADFGLARGHDYSVITRQDQVMGTLDYLAPELIRGQPANAASDIYALGCVVYECLAAGRPFSGSMFEVGMAVLESQPPDPCADRADAPPGLSAAALAALDKDPARRPSSATAYAETLAAAAGAAAA